MNDSSPKPAIEVKSTADKSRLVDANGETLSRYNTTESFLSGSVCRGAPSAGLHRSATSARGDRKPTHLTEPDNVITSPDDELIGDRPRAPKTQTECKDGSYSGFGKGAIQKRRNPPDASCPVSGDLVLQHPTQKRPMGQETIIYNL